MRQINQKEIASKITVLDSLFNQADDVAEKMKDIKKLSTAKEKTLDELKSQNEKINSKIVDLLGNTDVFSACTVATVACQSTPKANKAERQRMQRRRTRCIKTIAEKHTDFDVQSVKENNVAVIKPTYVGDKFTRQAKAIIANLTEYRALGLTVTIPKEERLAAILAERDSKKEIVTTGDTGQAIADVMQVMEAAKTAADKEQQKKNQKQQAQG